MKRTVVSIIMMTLVFCFSSGIMAAVKIVECEDEQGNKTFAKTCPAGYSVIGEKSLSTGKGSTGEETEGEVNLENVSATIYLISEGCAACDDAKEYLSSLGIKLNVINLENNLEQQNKLKELAGELRVPFVVIGDNMLKGYNRSKLESVIKEEALRLEKK